MTAQPDEHGGSLTELVVAAFLTLVAGAAALSAIAGPVRHWQEAAAPDMRRAEVEAAADAVAHLLRSARPGLGTPAVVDAGAARLELRIGPPSGGERVTVLVEDGALLVRAVAEDAAVASADERRLLGGVESDGLRIELLVADPDGALGASQAAIAGVLVTIEVDGISAMRAVAVRDDPVHARAVRW